MAKMICMDMEILVTDIAQRILGEEAVKIMSMMYHIDYNCDFYNCYLCQEGVLHSCNGDHILATQFEPAIHAFRGYGTMKPYFDTMLPLLKQMNLQERFNNALELQGIKSNEWEKSITFFQEYFTSESGLIKLKEMISHAPAIEVKTMAEWCFEYKAAPLRTGEQTNNSDPWCDTIDELSLNC